MVRASPEVGGFERQAVDGPRYLGGYRAAPFPVRTKNLNPDVMVIGIDPQNSAQMRSPKTMK
jgi:hypothetical protein